ncbi:hypothetical protein FOL47_005976 [Perkinsus chesapeaki]|uniref:MORN repeat-containing protein 5 n=1 Tax=Perkinsus chesapeaki TaxID=330153 RepID=A0A7J6LUN8_PERCH|nr:hypothetical protein FOL47_005976 [Perkinsus chesapeaki]
MTDKNGWKEGEGEYTFPNGTIYRGHFVNDEFDGEGSLIFPDGGTFVGTWQRGIAVDGKYFFGDGLEYKDSNWEYIVSNDRRFYSEVTGGIRPAGESFVTNDSTDEPKIPRGCFDLGNGYYDPSKRVIFDYNGTQVIGKPNEVEQKWIKENARSLSDASDIPTVEDTASVVTNAFEAPSIDSIRDSSMSFDEHSDPGSLSRDNAEEAAAASNTRDATPPPAAAASAAVESNDVPMCRICGLGTEEGPLYHPCRCSGTGHTEQEDEGTFVLENQRCELCGHKFSFRVVYAANAPSRLPLTYVLSETWKFLVSFIKKCLRPLYAVTIWLVLLPLVSVAILVDIFGVIDGFPDHLQIYGFILGPSSSPVSSVPWLSMFLRKGMVPILCCGIVISLCGFGLLQLWLHMRVAAVPMVVPTDAGTPANGGEAEAAAAAAPEEAEIEVGLENLLGLEGSLGPSISTWFVMLYANTIAMLALIVVPYYIGRFLYVHLFPSTLAYSPIHTVSAITQSPAVSVTSTTTSSVLATKLWKYTSALWGDEDAINNRAECVVAPTVLQPVIPDDPYLVYIQRIIQQQASSSSSTQLYPRPLVDDFAWDFICLAIGGMVCTQVAAAYHIWSTRGGLTLIGRVFAGIGLVLKWCIAIVLGGFLPSLTVGCVVLLALESSGSGSPLEPANKQSLMSLALSQLPVTVGAIVVMLVGHLVISVTQVAEQGVLSCLKPQARDAMRDSPAMVACFGHIIGGDTEGDLQPAGDNQQRRRSAAAAAGSRNKGIVAVLYYSLLYITYKLTLVFLCVLPALAFQHHYLPLQTRMVTSDISSSMPSTTQGGGGASPFGTSGSLDYLLIPVEFLCGHVLFPLVVRRPPMPPILAWFGRKIVRLLGLSSPFLDCGSPAGRAVPVAWTLSLVLRLVTLLALAAGCTLAIITTMPLIIGRKACKLILPATVLKYVDDLQAAPMGVVLTLLGGQVLLRLLAMLSSLPSAIRSLASHLANNRHLVRSFFYNTGSFILSLVSFTAATVFTLIVAPLLLGLMLYCLLVLPNSASDIVNTASAPARLFVFPCWVAGLVAMKVWILTVATRADTAWAMYDSHGILYPPLHREICINLLWPSVRVWLFHTTVPSTIAKILTVYLMSNFDSVDYICALITRYAVLFSIGLHVCFSKIIPSLSESISNYHRRMFDERYLVSTELENFEASNEGESSST